MVKIVAIHVVVVVVVVVSCCCCSCCCCCCPRGAAFCVALQLAPSRPIDRAPIRSSATWNKNQIRKIKMHPSLNPLAATTSPFPDQNTAHAVTGTSPRHKSPIYTGPQLAHYSCPFHHCTASITITTTLTYPDKLTYCYVFIFADLDSHSC